MASPDGYERGLCRTCVTREEPVLRRYILERKLGEGAFGVVHLAFDTLEKRRVAVKLLTSATPQAIEQFARETRNLYREINNRFVVRLLDHNIANTPPYIVLEYCEFGSLRAWVGKNRPWQLAIISFAQLPPVPRVFPWL
jgi:serine/threonine protein kinase